MNLEQKLRRWREAGLIDDATSARIAEYEHAERRPIGMYALIGLGASTIGLGLLSLVAANWEVIPAALKLAVDLALGIGLALLIELAVSRPRRLAREALITIFYGYTLASLALVGQIYQLDSPTYQALALWSFASLPLCLLGESLFLSVLYTAGLATTHAFALSALIDALEANVSDAVGRNVAACAAFASPLVYVMLSFVPWLRANRPHYVWSLRVTGVLGIVLGGFALAFFWYDGLSAGDTLTWSIAVTLLLALGFSVWLWRSMRGEPARTRTAVVCVVPAAWFLLALSTGFRHLAADYAGGLLQIAWLSLCAFVSYRAVWLRLFNAFTGLLALRILVVYFEVFGSLLDTGLGLVAGGVVTLLIGWAWQQKMRQLTARARGQTGAPSVS